jgi:hypothetical protein
MNTLYLLSILLVLTILSTYFVHKSRIENFEDDISFGILPKDKHPSRITNIMYYNDPIFIHYSDNYVLLNTDKDTVIGNKKAALSQIAYISPKKKIHGLTPISYMEPLYIKTYPTNNFNNIFNNEFLIVPYTRPINNQQPYVQINDIISFKTKNGDYLTINPLTNKLEIINSKTVPNNAIFKLSNSPQCYTNYEKYGIDTRNQSITTLSTIITNSRKHLEKKMKSLDGNEEQVRVLKKKEVNLKEDIEKSNNNKQYIDNQIEILKSEYDTTIANIKDNNDTLKLNVDKDITNRLELVENVIDSNYLKLMKETLDKGCN